MRIDNILQSLRVLIQADTLIAEAAFRSRLSQIALYGAAFVTVLFGLVMLGVTGFLLLRDLWGPVWAGLAIALASFALALVLTLIAASRKPDKQLQMARDMHTVALDSLIAEARLAGNDLSAVNALLHGRIDSTLLGLIGPLAMLLLRFLKKTPKPEAE